MMRSSTPRASRAPTLAVAALAWLCAPAPSAAQDAAPARDATPTAAPSSAAKVMEAVRVESPPRLDGRLDEAAWEEARFRSDFRQKGKDRGFDPRAATRVAILYDGDALWVGARMEHDGEASGVLGQRDDGGNADRILVSLDTFRDLRSAFTFGVTVSGVRIDHISARDNESWVDDSYDPVWDARVSADSTGWTAEMRIPFSQLRFPGGGGPPWGVNVRRWNPETYLNTYWVVVPYYESGWTSRFGELRGLDGIEGGAGVELTPYALWQTTATTGTSVPGGAGSPGGDESLTRYGGDVKVGLGPSLTLDATVRPDFGQVEADPARVNLSAFETFFPERRPFFTEGAELFRVRGPNWFYSRRIGSAPAGSVPRGSFERVQDATFLGGTKLTGRTTSGVSLGALAALTDRETLPLPGEGADAGSVAVAPRTLFLVGRAQQELGSAGSDLGVVATGVERFFASGSALEDEVARRAAAGGVDWTLRFGGGDYEVTGFAGGSVVSGTAAAVERIQASSAHFFQRPDAEHVSLDPEATALTGWAAGAGLEKRGGTHWLWSLGVEGVSPGFEIRDAGSQRRADRLDARASLTWRTRDGAGTVRDRSFGAWTASGWNFGGIRRHTSAAVSGAVTWENLWTTTLEGGVRLRSTSDDLTRGGPLMGTPLGGWVDAALYSSRAADASWNVLLSSYADELGTLGASLTGGWRLQASERLELDVQAGLTRADDARQFVAAVPGGRTETFGTRWVFSELERQEVFLRLRTKVAFAPDAVLTLYAEPFLSSGRFHDFGELEAAGARTVLPYGTDGITVEREPDGSRLVTDGEQEFVLGNYDFWVRSFRSSSVFRWEWRRGSTLFLIWQRNLASWTDRMRPTGAAELVDSLEDPGEDVFVVKVSLLLGL